jgi:hypothetical protein
VTTHVLNFKLKLSLGSLVGALEGQMLKEVSSSIGLIGFSTRSGIDVNTDGASGSVGVVFGSDGKAVGQLFTRGGQLQSISNGRR